MIRLRGVAALLGAALLAACATIPDATVPEATVAEAGTQVLAVQAQPNGPVLIETRMALDSGHAFGVEILHPGRAGTYPLIVFSSGNFASPDRYRRLLDPIAAAGYVIASPVHLDAEVLALDPPEPPLQVWQTRNAEFAFLAAAPAELTALLAGEGVTLTPGKIGLMGHSYGALVAQTGAGAKAWQMTGPPPDQTIAGADALVVFSPPGPIPGAIVAEGWSSIALPSFTQTGTADILPGFVDDWRGHKVSYEQTAPGARWLWVGEDVDHYFGGIYGREKPAPAQIEALFDHALAATIAFLDIHLKDLPDRAPTAPAAVTLTKD